MKKENLSQRKKAQICILFQFSLVIIRDAQWSIMDKAKYAAAFSSAGTQEGVRLIICFGVRSIHAT